MDLLRSRRATDRSSGGRAGRLVTALVALCLRPHTARAQFVDPTFPVTDRGIQAFALAGDTLFAAGTMQYVGPNTGCFGIVNATSGEREAGWPRVDGAVLTMAADGAGGWFLGGKFQRVAGVPRRGLAHIRADGSLDGWNPSPDGTVSKLVLDGSRLFVCGGFINIGGQLRPKLAELDVQTGLATLWSPAPIGDVYEVALSGTTLYAGGTFTSMGGQPRSCLAAFHVTTGQLTPWNPTANYYVSTIVPHGGVVYLAGEFTRLGGEERLRCAAVDSVNGLPTPWTPDPVSGPIFAIAFNGSRVYLGGAFTTYYASDGRSRHCLEAVDAVSGALVGWVPGTDSTYWDQFDIVNHIEVRGSTVIVGGSFSEISSRRRLNLAEIDATTGVATAWNPGANAQLLTFVLDGDRVAAGGHFNSIGGTKQDGAAAIALGSGAVLAWHPDVLASQVFSATRNNTALYLSGYMSMAGQWHPGLGALDPSTAQPTAWNPAADATVRALATSESAVYMAGQFHTVGGHAHTGLAAVDPVTGEVQAWDPSADNSVESLALADSTIIVGGYFTHAGGQPRARIAALDLRTAAATAWDPGADGPVQSLCLNGPLVYVGGTFSNIGGKPRNSLAALDATTGLATSWNPSPNAPIEAIAVNGSTVFASGLFTSAGGKPRSNFVALDAATGLATSWDPATDYTMVSLAVSGPATYAGGWFNTLGGRAVHGLARILPLPATPPNVHVLWPNGGQTMVNHAVNFVSWSAGAPLPGIESVDVYLSRTGSGGPWQLMAAGLPNSAGYSLMLDDAVASSNGFVRIDARDYAGNIASDLSDAAFVIGDGVVGVGQPGPGVAVTLGNVAPDPARNDAQIEFTLPRSARVELSLLDVQGRWVRVLHDGDAIAGRHRAAIDTRALSTGLYFVRLRCGGAEQVRRFIVLR